MSLRRLLRKIHLRLRKRPRSARDVIPGYEEYLRLQREVYMSHESEMERWAEGQRRFVSAAFADVPRSARVLDCACGDGVGLEALAKLGFTEITGIELSSVKAEKARSHGFPVEERDMHDLSIFPDGTFDAILSSHTLEHAYDPGRVVAELHRLLSPAGALFVALPFPDPSPRNELAHAAKYELGTYLDDGGEAVTQFFEERGFALIEQKLDSFREPEVWLFLLKERRP